MRQEDWQIFSVLTDKAFNRYQAGRMRNIHTTKEKAHDFSQGSIPGNILRLSLPLIAAQFINVLYNIVDRISGGFRVQIQRLLLAWGSVSLSLQ